MTKIAAFDTGYPPPEIEGLLRVTAMAEDLNNPAVTLQPGYLAELGRLACEANAAYFGVQVDVPPPPPPPDPPADPMIEGGSTGPMEPKS